MFNSNEKENTLITLLLVREIATILCGKKGINTFYELFDDDPQNISRKFTRFIRMNESDNIQSVIDTLVSWGIPDEFFHDKAPIAKSDSDKLYRTVCNFLSTFRGTVVSCDAICVDIRDLLSYRLYEPNIRIIFDCIANQFLLKNSVQDIYDYSQDLANVRFDVFHANLHMKKFYENVGQMNVSEPDKFLRIGKIFFTNEVEYNVTNLLILIRELFNIFIQMDNSSGKMTDLINYLNIDNFPGNSIPTVTDKNYRILLNKLSPYRFPASLFQPTNDNFVSNYAHGIPCCKQINDAINDYRDNIITITQLRSVLLLNIKYKIDSDNAILFLAVYALYQNIESAQDLYNARLAEAASELSDAQVKNN